MFSETALLGLASFSLVASITPGPNNLMLMASGANHGFQRTLPHLFGVALGFTLMIVLVGVGLAQAFEQFPALHLALKIFSIGYLGWLAWRLATTPTSPAGEQGAARARPMTFLQAALFQWVNPKAWTMALTAVTVYAPSGRSILAIAATALVFGAINLPSVAMWAAAGTQVRRWLDAPWRLRAFNVTAAALLIASLAPVVFDG